MKMKMNLLNWSGIVLLVLIISWDQSPKFAYADLIEDTCNKTSYAKLCVSVLRSSPRSATADVKGLVQIAVEYLQAYVKDTLALSEKLFKEEKNPSVKGGLRLCVDQYALGLHRVGDTINFLNSGDYRNAHDIVLTVADDASTCNDAGTGTLLKDRNSQVTNSTRLAMEMIQILG
ncbi:PREDICTED: pectinesterase inhibitor-like [Fragaria vesca subsp. vesca]|uniref:pectinesterase inhibitor-like n=1 Tax=Fragaria vesca subsp. vesca TaxID=101020 RepID=UPI0002C32856|nr:PREDICTED: pectinesterase inhibitor-like [Fragaria vesca subsp. vesca]